MKKTNYHHLDPDERDCIAVRLADGLSLGKIARILGRDKSTISREVRRNRPQGRQGAYFSNSAQGRARQRWMENHKKERLANPVARGYVEAKISLGWSPELVAGRIGLDLPGMSVSHEAIYQYIYLRARRLIPHLARGGFERKRRGCGHSHKKPHIPGRVDISLRPESVAGRKEPGHWEADLMESGRSGKSALNVLIERVSRLALLTKVSDGTSKKSSSAVTRRLSITPEKLRRSVTYDNGSENADHILVNQTLGTDSYFCAPYHSWEKGTVENTVGLVRRWLPKRTNLDTVSDDKIMEIERWLNDRPRKCLAYKTPLEVFNMLSVALAG